MSTQTLTAAAGSIAMVAAGVIVAGWIMWQFRDVGLIGDARNGFDV